MPVHHHPSYVLVDITCIQVQLEQDKREHIQELSNEYHRENEEECLDLDFHLAWFDSVLCQNKRQREGSTRHTQVSQWEGKDIDDEDIHTYKGT